LKYKIERKGHNGQTKQYLDSILIIYYSRMGYNKPEEKRPLGRPRLRWVDNNRTDLQEVGCGYIGLDWAGPG